MYEIETKSVYDDFSESKENFDFSNYSAKSKCYDDLNAFVFDKVKEEMHPIAVEKFVWLKSEMCLIGVNNSSE